MDSKKLEYSFLRAEKNAEIVMFVKVEPQWIDKEIEIGLVEKKLSVTLPTGENYESEVLEPILLERLQEKITPVIFSDEEGNYLAEIDLIPPEKTVRKIKP